MQPPVLNIQPVVQMATPQEFPPLPTETLAGAHATTLEWVKARAATSQDLRRTISDLDRFDGAVGELNHFLKGGDRVMSRIRAREGQNLLGEEDAAALRAALVCRVKRSVLNMIQADEDTPWPTVKDRLKKAFGGGRWAPEEDILQMFREKKQQHQTNGQYAGNLLARFNGITEKMRELMSPQEVEGRMAFLSVILKVQLARDTGRKEGLPREKGFVDCAREMIDASAREEEARGEEEAESGWSRVAYRRTEIGRTRARPETWRKRGGEFGGSRMRERRPGKERRSWAREERRCHGCGKTGHLVANCPRTKCFECGNEGHIARQCPYMSRRGEVNRGEPMEVNAQRLWRRRRPSSETDESAETSGTEEEGAEPREGRARGNRNGRRNGERGVTAESRGRRED